MSIYIGYVYTDDGNPASIMTNAIYKVYIMNPVRAIVENRLRTAFELKKRTEKGVIAMTANVLIALAESDEYQLQTTHFMDYFPAEYGDIEGINWNTLVYNEVSTIVGINAWIVQESGKYVISTGPHELLKADLTKYFK